MKAGEWVRWSLCASADDSNGAATTDCYEGSRVDSLTYDSNQYAYDFRVIDWNSNHTQSVTNKTKSAMAEAPGLSRPEVVFTDSRGILHGVWDRERARYAFLHLNDHYVGVSAIDGLGMWASVD